MREVISSWSSPAFPAFPRVVVLADLHCLQDTHSSQINLQGVQVSRPSHQAGQRRQNATPSLGDSDANSACVFSVFYQRLMSDRVRPHSRGFIDVACSGSPQLVHKLGCLHRRAPHRVGPIIFTLVAPEAFFRAPVADCQRLFPDPVR